MKIDFNLLIFGFLILGLTSGFVASDDDVAIESGVQLAQNSSADPIAELAAWDYAVTSGDLAEIELFIQQYPDGQYAADARVFLSSLSYSGSDDDATMGDAPILPAPVNSEIDTIIYDEPSVADSQGVLSSLRELIKNSPSFAPVEQLPEEYWENETCSNCHEWDKTSLCTQGEFYMGKEPNVINRIDHPYGGYFKEALQLWAEQGCL